MSVKPKHSRSYEDFVIGSPSPIFFLLRPVAWLFGKLRRDQPSKYYPTTVRRVGKSKVEVTFDLPPMVKQRMHHAIEAGKQIRLFVL